MDKFIKNTFDPKEVANYMDELPLWSAPFGLKLLDKVQYKTGLKVLDIGFGTGFPLTELAMRLGNTSFVYGIDLWEEAIERAQQKINFYEIDNAHLINASAEAIPFEDETIDLITSNNGINNVKNIEKAFEECFRVLKPRGQFVQTMNLDQSMFEFYQIFEDVLSSMDMAAAVDKMHSHITEKRPSVDQLKSMLLNKGFIIQSIDFDQFKYHFADASALLNHYFIRLAFFDSWINIVPKDSLKEVFNEIELRLDERKSFTKDLTLTIPFITIDVTKE